MGTAKTSKWKLWRSSHSGGGVTTSIKSAKVAAGRLSESVASDSSYVAAMAAMAQASARDFKLIRQEWAVIRIQTAFRAFLVIN